MPVPYGKSAFEYLFHIRYHIFWSLDFYLVVMASIVIPFIPAMIDLKTRERIRYLAFSTNIFLSSLVVESMDVVVFLLTGKSVFF